MVYYQNFWFYVTLPGNIPEDVRRHFKRQKPTGVMLCATVDSDLSKSRFVFIEEVVKMNSIVYQKILGSDVLPWLSTILESRYVLSQDVAPAHITNSGYFDKSKWLPSSPYINNMDFAISSIRRAIFKFSHNQVCQTTMKALMTLWYNLGEEFVMHFSFRSYG